MFFGLTNSPATFQALMNSIFVDLIAKGRVAVYLDDILIYSTTLEEHHQTTHEVLRRLQENDLYLRPEKCEFDQKQVEYLGMVIYEGQVSMDPVKVHAVREWATPRNLQVDASGYATGGVILQQLEDGLWHPVAYRSESMAPAEWNYKIYDQEMLAIIWALEDWRHYLEEWEEEDGLVYYKEKLYVPEDKGLHTNVLKQCHDVPTAGHLGEHGTLEQGCERCQHSKPAAHPDATLHLHDVPEGLWNVVGVDLITELPESQGYDAIITYVDLYSKQVHVLLMVTTLDARGVTDIHYREIFHLHGIPHKFVSDRGPQFAAQVTHALYKHLGIQVGLTTAYHPSENGQTEQANQEIEQFLHLFVSKHQDDWADWLPTAEFVLNSRVHTAHDKSPFEVVYGYRPDFTIPAGRRMNKFLALEARLEGLKKIQEEAEAALWMGKEKMKEAYEEEKRKVHEFKVGDKVWLSAKDIHIHPASRKLGPRQLGPYEVVEHIGDLDYCLKLPPAMKVHNQAPAPEAVEVEGEEQHLVEEVLDSRIYRKKLQYLVRWEGYGEEEDSWEPAENLDHAKTKVRQFYKKNPNAPTRVAAALFATLPWQKLENFTEATTDLVWEEGKRVGHGLSQTIEFREGVM
uniref:Reverse transcriptase-rnase h-integrase n=1 Tax=Moniliophthora roreri TaxID=221103 RepID=A0A0W0GF46_MONRR